MSQVSPEKSRPLLRVCRSEADQRIGQQLIRGRRLEQTRIRSYAVLEEAQAAFDCWCEATETLLHELFVGPAAAQEYRRYASNFETALWFDRSKGLERARRKLNAAVDSHLKALSFYLDILPFLPEPAAPPPSERPTIQDVPKAALTDGRESAVSTIEANALRLLALIVEGQEEHYKPEWLAEQTGLPPQDLRDACQLLAEWGAVRVGVTIAPPYGIHTVFLLGRGRILYREWQAEQEKDDMPREPAATPSPSKLRIPRLEVSRKIRAQIRKGRQLRDAEITTPQQLEKADAAFLSWRAYNLEMLNQLFEGGAIVSEFEQAATYWGPIILVTGQDPFPGSVERHRQLTRDGVNALEAILNRLKTIPEPEQGDQPRASLTKEGGMSDKGEQHITRLRVPRTEAEQEIKRSIERGREIRAVQIRTQEEAIKATQETEKWHRFNGHLLRRLFSTADVAHGLGSVPFNNAATARRFLATTAAKQHQKNVDDRLTYMESVLEGLPQFQEPSEWQQEQPGSQVMPNRTSKETCVFIGHGRSKLWARLVVEITNRWKLKPVYYEFESRTSQSIVPILERMLDQATFAVLLLTAEDETAEKGMRARQNVVHEAGLFQGRLGFTKAVLLVQKGVEEFSNVDGLQVIFFDGDHIESTFYELQEAMKREGVLA